MKTVVYHHYGPPDVLQLEDVPIPTPNDDEVLIRVDATTVTPTDCAARSGRPASARLVFGLTRPRTAVLGGELAGRVEAVGGSVDRFREGDDVVAVTGAELGTHAEYVCMSQDASIVPRPADMTAAEALAAFGGGLTALPFLRDEASIGSGDTVLVNGAAGAIGTAAVQLARHAGATVVGVCSAPKAELVRSLGAAKVIDYTAEDFTDAARAYEIIFDAVGASSFRRSRRALTRDGMYLTTVPSVAIALQMAWTCFVSGPRAVVAFTGLRSTAAKTADLRLLSRLVDEGQLQPVLDRCYPLDAAAEAHRYVETGHKTGTVVLTTG